MPQGCITPFCFSRMSRYNRFPGSLKLGKKCVVAIKRNSNSKPAKKFHICKLRLCDASGISSSKS